MTATLFIIAFIFVFDQHITKADDSELLQVHVLFRHGDRTPITFYPRDPWKGEIHWPEGFGQLINKGKERHLRVGQYLRRRYDNFLPSAYNYNDIFVRSTDVDRTLMSAYCNLAGLYPPNGAQVWNANFSWQPIPVHTVPIAMDKLLRDDAVCPQADLELNKVESSDAVQKILREHEGVLDYITDHAGNLMRTFRNVSFFHDTLFIEEQRNLTLPKWTAKVYPEKTAPLSAKEFAINHYSETLRRLRGGPLLKDMIEHMYSKIEEGSSLKMLMNSAHDTTISMFLTALGAFDPQIPSYSSVVTVELHRKKKNHFVKVFYQNKTNDILNGNLDVEPYLLTIPGCTPECPLHTFHSILLPVIPVDWEEECGGWQPSSADATLSSAASSGILTTVMVAGFILLLAAILGLTLYKLRRHKQDATMLRLLSAGDNRNL